MLDKKMCTYFVRNTEDFQIQVVVSGDDEVNNHNVTVLMTAAMTVLI
jgi:acylphosphatase